MNRPPKRTSFDPVPDTGDCPPTCRDLMEWPDRLRPHVQRLGPSRVWDAGLFQLGYPPTWCLGAKEMQPLVVHLATVKL